MKNTFGPWSSGMNTGVAMQLSAFWRRRMNELVQLDRNDAALRRRDWIRIVGVGLVAAAMPLLRPEVPTDANETDPPSKLAPPADDETEKCSGVVHRLPGDGAWVRYELKATAENRPEPEVFTVTLSSVGQLTAEAEKCRWLELKFENRTGFLILKLLIQEKYLNPGEHHLTHVLRGWKKRKQDAAESLNEREIKELANAGELLWLFTPPLVDVRRGRRRSSNAARNRLTVRA